jgi:hypothetical protein
LFHFAVFISGGGPVPIGLRRGALGIYGDVAGYTSDVFNMFIKMMA